MNEAFYFWKDGVRITALYRNPILKLELFAIVWNCFVCACKIFGEMEI